jgi:hypothetical protein
MHGNLFRGKSVNIFSRGTMLNSHYFDQRNSSLCAKLMSKVLHTASTFPANVNKLPMISKLPLFTGLHLKSQ